MTAFGHEERVQESGVVGHSYDTDDRLEDLDIYEALVNPHDGQGGAQRKGGGGAPAMMPMGNTGSASKASGFSGTGGAGVSGVSGAGYGSAGLGADALSGVGGTGSAGLGGLSSGLGTGGLGSGAGSSWTYPSYGTGAAGLPDPTLDQPGTTPTGGFTVPSVGTPPTTTVPTPTVPGTASGIPPIKVPSASSPGASGITVPSAGGAGGAASANTAGLGVRTVQASLEMLHKEAQHWDETARDFTANVANPVGNQSPSSVDFGMMTDAFSPYNDLLNRLKKWSTDAGAEFSAISDALQSASGGYKDTEDTNTAASTQVQTHSSIPV